MKKLIKISIAIILVALNIFCIYLFPNIKTEQVSSIKSSSHIIVTVLEKGSNIPIDNAKLCIIETKEYFATNKNGVSDKISVPILKNSNLNSSLEQNWGEITILVYKSGYSDHIQFYEQIPINKTKYGTIIHLTPIYSSSDTAPTITTNAPNNSWIQKLIQVYKK